MTDMSEQNLSNFSMTDLFRQEVASQTGILTDGLLALEHQPADKKQLEILMRAAHSIKGAARIMGLDPAVKVAHALEDNFVAAQQDKITVAAAQTDVLLEGVDFLLKISKCPDSDIAAGAPALLPDAEALLKKMSLAREAASSPAQGVPKPTAASESAAQPNAAAAPQQKEEEAKLASKDASAASRQEQGSQTVRITAEHLNRVLGLVDESIVQMRWLDPFIRRLQARKSRQANLGRRLEDLRRTLDHRGDYSQAKQDLNDIIFDAKDFLEHSAAHINDIDDFSRRMEELNNRLYRKALASRMRPFGDCARGFPRMMRDLARRLGKNMRFEISGQDTQVDREILDKLEAPLAHLLRNSLDHGIEMPGERKSAGKSEEALVTLNAYHHAGLLHIVVSDDGRGIDLEQIRQKIIARGLSSAEVAARLTEQEILNFLFLPGFSTSPKVTEISGRGVGLDIVLNLAQELGGNVRIDNRRPNGSMFHLQLPITLSVVRALLVEIAREPFILPLARVAHLTTIEPSSIAMIEGRPYFKYNGQNVGLIAASEALELKGSLAAGVRTYVVIINDQNSHYGLVVDRFLRECMVVVRPLDPRLGKVQDVGAVTLLDDGTPAVILDVDDLLRSIDRILGGGGLKTIARVAEEKSRKSRRRVLVADDSITVRELERKLLLNRGYQVDVSVDGMEAWNHLRAFPYDLLVSDVDMPRLNGIDLVRRVRQDQKMNALPVIIISYKDREEDRLRGMEAGANYYLTKSSFQDETFIKAVTDLIGEAAQ